VTDVRGECGGLLPFRPEWEDRPALADARADKVMSRGELRQAALRAADALGGPERRLAFILADRSAESLIAMLAAAAAGHGIALIDAASADAKLAALLDRYQPDLVLSPARIEAPPSIARDSGWRKEADVEGVARWSSATAVTSPSDLHPSLFLLLPTSGTTGTPRFVRLSYEAIASNARQIAEALAIDETSVGIAHLPIHYSYGLSVVTSHWTRGANVVIIEDGVTSPAFWESVAKFGGTHFPGVPFHYSTIARLGLDRLPESVTTLTQAGGALDLRFQNAAHDFAKRRGAKFYVMYGQTEAAPRITTLQHEDFERKIGSVGQALSGGALTIEHEGVPVAPGATGSVVYRGPNVMLGLAEGRADLTGGDETGRRLETGDLGYLDDEGFLFLKGRAKRFAKVLGLRISLDQVEKDFTSAAPAYCVEGKEKVIVFFEGDNEASVTARARALAAEYKIPVSSFSLRRLDEIPRMSGAKVDYTTLKEIAGV
jgi:acyl-CoA synthetase (AMP-forming)/AMP-acid ligase II